MYVQSLWEVAAYLCESRKLCMQASDFPFALLDVCQLPSGYLHVA